MLRISSYAAGGILSAGMVVFPFECGANVVSAVSRGPGQSFRLGLEDLRAHVEGPGHALIGIRTHNDKIAFSILGDEDRLIGFMRQRRDGVVVAAEGGG